MLSCNQQCQTVDRKAKTDQEKHVDGKQFELPWVCQVILCVLKRIPDKPSPVGHGDVEIVALRAVHLQSLRSALTGNLLSKDNGVNQLHSKCCLGHGFYTLWKPAPIV